MSGIVSIHLSPAHVSLHIEKNLLNELNSFRPLEDVGVNVWLKRLSTVEEVSLVLGFSLLLLASFRQLIVCHLKRLAINDVVVAGHASIRSTIRGLVADECSRIRNIFRAGDILNALDLTEG